MMKKAFLITLFTLGIILGCDFFVGEVSRHLLKNVPDAGIIQTNAAMALFKKEADVLVLGSSRANHHYVPEVIKEEMGLSCYNAGRDGKDIIYADMVLRAFAERCTPIFLLLDLSESMLDGSWNYSTTDMNCFYGASKPVTDIIDETADWQMRLKLLSNLYRYNNTLPWLFEAYRNKDKDSDGYIPLAAEDNFMSFHQSEGKPFRVDGTCLHYIKDILAFCKQKDIQVVGVISPSLSYTSNGFEQWVSNFFAQQGFETFDYGRAEKYIRNSSLFYDATHLNDKGARLFTEEVVSRLKDIEC